MGFRVAHLYQGFTHAARTDESTYSKKQNILENESYSLTFEDQQLEPENHHLCKGKSSGAKTFILYSVPAIHFKGL